MMREVRIRLLGLKVNSFSLPDNSVEVEITFDDGNLKQIYRTVRLENSKLAAESLLADMVKMERNINSDFDGETLITNANIYLEDLGENIKDVTGFFNNVHGKLLQIGHKKDAQGYIGLVNELHRMELRLDE